MCYSFSEGYTNNAIKEYSEKSKAGDPSLFIFILSLSTHFMGLLFSYSSVKNFKIFT